tara:strand:+ start:209 stop:544 length:336 start_codon:yes stop_codon:yes gene_type:complete
MLDSIIDGLKKIINKLKIIIGLCLVLGLIIYFTPLKDIFNGKVEEKVEEFKKETKEKIEAKKKEVKEKVEKVENKIDSNVKEVEDKIDSNIKKVEDKVKDLKKLKLKDIIK